MGLWREEKTVFKSEKLIGWKRSKTDKATEQKHQDLYQIWIAWKLVDLCNNPGEDSPGG